MKAQVSRQWASLGRRAFTTATSLSFESMTGRPAKLIPDYLSPTSSRLLDITLADLLPNLPPCKRPADGGFLPQGHHLAYFPIQSPPSKLASDGADLDHWPGPPYHRRMWAGGEVQFSEGWDKKLVLDGRRVRCDEKIEEVRLVGEGDRQKVFVDVWRYYGLAGEEREDSPVRERRTLVFMKGDPSKASIPAAAADSTATPKVIKYSQEPTASYTLTPSSLHLFHFSALSFNAHAIHLDTAFARSDGHRDLLVHGPLTLALILRVISAHLSDGTAVRSIAYRNYAPLYVNEEMKICVKRTGKATTSGGEEWTVWAEGPQGGLAVKGSVVVGDMGSAG